MSSRPPHPALLVAFAIASAWSASARAEDDAAQDTAIEVTVHGASAGAFTGRASADDAVRTPKDAASLVAELPGVHVRRLGAEGSYATLSVRGSASTQVGVVLGGIPLTSAADPSFDVGALPLWPGATMRVYRGFAPAALGTTGYLGGVLAVDTPSPALGEKTEASLVAGSFGSLSMRAGDLRRIGPVTFGTGLFASRTDGDFTYSVDDPRTGALVTRTRSNARVVGAGGIERAFVSGAWGSAGATLLVDARERGLPGSASAPTTAASLTTSRLVAGVDGVLRVGSRAGVHAAAWARRESLRYSDPLGEIDPASPTVEQAITSAGGSLGLRGRPADAWTVDVFVDGRGEQLDPELGAGAVSARRVAGGVGAEIEWRASRALTLGASGRFDAWRDTADEARLQTPGEASAFAAPTGHLGASYRLLDGALVLAAHAGALERPPGFVELYGDLGPLVGDATLRPERALSADAGAAGAVDVGSVKLGYEVVGFATSARDLIAFVPLGVGTLRATNLDRASLVGAEATLSLATRSAALRASYTYLRSENLGDDPLAHGRPLPGRPAHDLVYDAVYRVGPLRLRYGLDVVGGSTIDTRGALVLPTRVLHGAGATLTLSREPLVTLGLDVDNLFDARVRHPVDVAPLATRPVAVPVSDLLGFPLPGRTVMGTLRVVFAR
jgi:iron complex outermembrane receptor protein